VSLISFSALQRAEIAEIIAAKISKLPIDNVSVLFNEPKLLKFCFRPRRAGTVGVSVLFNEPKLLKLPSEVQAALAVIIVSVLFNEPKLLKCSTPRYSANCSDGFSALQRAEIAEIVGTSSPKTSTNRFQCSSTSRNC